MCLPVSNVAKPCQSKMDVGHSSHMADTTLPPRNWEGRFPVQCKAIAEIVNRS